MIVVADTNIIVRIAAKVDNLEQKAAAIKLLDEARNFEPACRRAFRICLV